MKNNLLYSLALSLFSFSWNAMAESKSEEYHIIPCEELSALPYNTYGIKIPENGLWKCEALVEKTSSSPLMVRWRKGEITFVFYEEPSEASTNPDGTPNLRSIVLDHLNGFLFPESDKSKPAYWWYRCFVKGIFFSENSDKVAIYSENSSGTIPSRISNFWVTIYRKNTKSAFTAGCVGCTHQDFLDMAVMPALRD